MNKKVKNNFYTFLHFKRRFLYSYKPYKIIYNSFLFFVLFFETYFSGLS